MTWNVQSLNRCDPLVHLFGPASLLRKLPSVVLLQECRSLKILLPESSWVQPFFYDGFQTEWAKKLGHLPMGNSRALLTRDCGIILNDPTWRVAEQEVGENWARVTVELPQPLVEGDEQSRRLTLFSIHSLRRLPELWSEDKAGLSRYFASATTDSRVIDRCRSELVADNDLDNTLGYPSETRWSHIAPYLQALHLVDGYRILKPRDREMTRVEKTKEGSARRLDSIWIPRGAAPMLSGYQMIESSRSDHRLFTLTLGGGSGGGGGVGIRGSGSAAANEGFEAATPAVGQEEAKALVIKPCVAQEQHRHDRSALAKAVRKILGNDAPTEAETMIGVYSVLVEKLGAPLQGIVKTIAELAQGASLVGGREDSNILERVDFVDAHLLPRLWEALALCPLPLRVESKVRVALSAFVFDDRQLPWADITVLPRRVGGLGIIATEDMLLAQTLAIAVPYLTGTHSSSRAFKQGFHDYIVKECRSSPSSSSAATVAPGSVCAPGTQLSRLSLGASRLL